MRWDIYLNQTQGAGHVTMAVCLVTFGIFSWWYLIQKAPWLDLYRPRLTEYFWVLICVLYFVMMGLIFFAWPEV